MSVPRLTFRTRFLIGLLACIGLLSYALYVQFAQRLMPCDFCILQRIAFAAAGLVFLLGALHAPRDERLRRFYGTLAALPALIGAGIAARHAWVQMYPPAMPSCSGGMTYLVDTQGVFGMLSKVLTASGDCSAIDWRFLGLTMPMWTLLCFLAVAGWALLAGSRPRRRFAG